MLTPTPYSSLETYERTDSIMRHVSECLQSSTDYYTNEAELNFITSTNQYFKRTWWVGHRLDQHSSLLQPSIRDKIKELNGNWPENLNNYRSIRQSMQPFDELIVTLNGTCNGQNVSAMKVYTPLDIIIGYKFVQMEKFDESAKRVTVDMDLMNNVVKQECGGAEPLII